jgi:hypothetical protein
LHKAIVGAAAFLDAAGRTGDGGCRCRGDGLSVIAIADKPRMPQFTLEMIQRITPVGLQFGSAFIGFAVARIAAQHTQQRDEDQKPDRDGDHHFHQAETTFSGIFHNIGLLMVRVAV